MLNPYLEDTAAWRLKAQVSWVNMSLGVFSWAGAISLRVEEAGHAFAKVVVKVLEERLDSLTREVRVRAKKRLRQ